MPNHSFFSHIFDLSHIGFLTMFSFTRWWVGGKVYSPVPCLGSILRLTTRKPRPLALVLYWWRKNIMKNPDLQLKSIKDLEQTWQSVRVPFIYMKKLLSCRNLLVAKHGKNRYGYVFSQISFSENPASGTTCWELLSVKAL